MEYICSPAYVTIETNTTSLVVTEDRFWLLFFFQGNHSVISDFNQLDLMEGTDVYGGMDGAPQGDNT